MHNRIILLRPGHQRQVINYKSQSTTCTATCCCTSRCIKEDLWPTRKIQFCFQILHTSFLLGKGTFSSSPKNKVDRCKQCCKQYHARDYFFGIRPSLSLILTNDYSQVISQTLRGWCSLYECKPGKSIFAVISHIIAALLFSPWTFLDGCIGALVAQSAGNILLNTYSRVPNKRVGKNFIAAGAGGQGVGAPYALILFGL